MDQWIKNKILIFKLLHRLKNTCEEHFATVHKHNVSLPDRSNTETLLQAKARLRCTEAKWKTAVWLIVLFYLKIRILSLLDQWTLVACTFVKIVFTDVAAYGDGLCYLNMMAATNTCCYASEDENDLCN